MIGPVDVFSLPFMQTAALEIAILAALAGLIGSQIALRGLAFLAHGAGAATFPGVVLAAPLGIPAPVGALATSLGFTAVTQGRRLGSDARTAVALVLALAAGIVLASDVFGSGAGVDQLLFGSLLAIDTPELVASAAALAICVVAWLVLRRRWLVAGFDPLSARSLVGSPRRDGAVLLVAVCVAVVAAVDAVGALLVSAIMVVPALTVLPFARSTAGLALATALLALAEGLGGLIAAFYLDAPPGGTIAVIGGVVFAAACVFRGVRGTDRSAAAAGAA
ncbi:metal ABC transporter permease [Thermoleophilia bacterium SCSIO 60948]|nr:metal ABC transporter permease [Thermoleophilia bacterium SCSIO 60948]